MLMRVLNVFRQCKWSRKGYLRTRWQLNGTTFDLVNIHLFHDASNFVAMQTVSFTRGILGADIHIRMNE